MVSDHQPSQERIRYMDWKVHLAKCFIEDGNASCAEVAVLQTRTYKDGMRGETESVGNGRFNPSIPPTIFPLQTYSTPVDSNRSTVSKYKMRSNNTSGEIPHTGRFSQLLRTFSLTSHSSISLSLPSFPPGVLNFIAPLPRESQPSSSLS